VAVTARANGRRTLPGVAADTPGVLDGVRRGTRAGLVRGVPALVVQLVPAAFLVPAGGPAAFGGYVLAATGLVTLGLTALWLRARGRERRILESFPWQVWHCRTDEVRVVSSEGRRSRGRTWSKDLRLVLLRPDGQARCSFPLPGPGVRDEVWFAGDVTTEGVLAVPGGLPWRYVRRVGR
jgi:hypothetical protein